MDKRIKIIAAIVMLPLSIVVPVFLAQTVALDSHVYAQQDTLQTRVEAYKAKLSQAPSQAELNRLKLRCSVAQTVFKNLQTRVGTVQEKRVAAYDGVNKNLTDLDMALKAKSIDTAKLDSQIKELETKMTAFKDDMKSYKQAVEDSAAVDCAADPLALRASLEVARADHQRLVTNVADIRTYVNNTIKPTLGQIKTDLQAQAAAGATPTTEPQGVTPDAAQ